MLKKLYLKKREKNQNEKKNLTHYSKVDNKVCLDLSDVGSEWRFLVSQNRVANATFEAIRMKNASDSSDDFTFNRFSTHFTIHVGSVDFL